MLKLRYLCSLFLLLGLFEICFEGGVDVAQVRVRKCVLAVFSPGIIIFHYTFRSLLPFYHFILLGSAERPCQSQACSNSSSSSSSSSSDSSSSGNGGGSSSSSGSNYFSSILSNA
jgi:uncharacterized membrane protein YgcG